MTLLLLASLLGLIAIGVPVAYSLGISVLLYIVLVDPQLILVLPLQVFAGFNSYALLSLPLFILMGQVMNAAQITSRLIDFSMLLAGRFRTGLGLVNVLASMLFGGISGSSASDTASIGSVLIPEMEKRGYKKEVAAGITVASSTMGMVIPPSIPMVLYAVVAQASVGKLFLGGVFPGVMVGLFQMLLVRMLAKGREGTSSERVTLASAASRTLRSLPVLLMPIVIVGSVVFGIATATESAALGVLYAAATGFVLTRALKVRAVLGLPAIDSADKRQNHDRHRALASVHLDTGARKGAGGDRRIRSRIGFGSDWHTAAGEPDRSGRRHDHRRKPSDPASDPGLRPCPARSGGLADPFRGPSSFRAGGRRMHASGRHLPERRRSGCKPRHWQDFPWCRAVPCRERGNAHPCNSVS